MLQCSPQMKENRDILDSIFSGVPIKYYEFEEPEVEEPTQQLDK